jgi:hypothetical protein
MTMYQHECMQLVKLNLKLNKIKFILKAILTVK